MAFERWGLGRMMLAMALGAGSIRGQVLNNQSLTGKFWFRHLSLGMDARGNVSDPRSLLGAITFDGVGGYTFTGQQVQGANAAASVVGAGTYSVDPAGFVSLDSPIRSGAKVNARLGSEALLGSSTESGDNTFDLFVAIPASAARSGPAPSLTGSYWTASLELPGGSLANLRNSLFSLSPTAGGRLADFAVSGHAANLPGGPTTQQVTGANFAIGADGAGSASFGPASSSQLLSGSKTICVSVNGNLILGGSTDAGAHDILIGVKAVSNASNSTWNGRYWGAGLRIDESGVTAYAGAVASTGLGKLTWTKRFKLPGVGGFDFTGVNSYALRADASAAVELTQAGVGAGGKAFVGSATDQNAPNAYEIYFGAQMIPVSGSGIFLNPQGVVNAASFAPAGNPISPGEYITLFGTGFPKTTLSANPPYPTTLNGVTVLINNKPAPLYLVGPVLITAVVPYATAGATATIMLQSGGASSNIVTVPVAATTPGIFSIDQSGSGAGAIQHADFSLVSSSSPAKAGETVIVYLTGMGLVDPAVADGTAGGVNPFSRTSTDVSVLVGGRQATVVFSGLVPGAPALYQMNLQLPATLPASGNLPLAISTPNAFHDQVDIAVSQ